MTRRQIPVSTVVCVSALLLSWTARAQQPPAAQRGAAPAAPAPQNLQVLAKDTPQPQVVQAMQSIATGLGVQCGYCHVQNAQNAQNAAPQGGQAGRGGRGRGGPPPFDFASDEKPKKKVAREMLLMVRDINTKVAAAVGKPADTVTRAIQGSSEEVLRRRGDRLAAGQPRIFSSFVAKLRRPLARLPAQERQGRRDEEHGKSGRARSAERAVEAAAGSGESSVALSS